MNRISTESSIPVLFVLPTLGAGGSEQVIFNLCVHLDRSYFPIVAAFRDGALREEMTDSGIEVHVLNRRSGIDLMLIIKLLRIIRRKKIRIVNSHHFVSLFYAFWAARFAGLPIIHTEHSIWEMQSLSFFWTRCYRFFLKRIEMVSAVSETAFNYLRDAYGIEEKRIGLVVNGIDINRFKKAKEETVNRAALDLKPHDIVVGTVGNLRREKNQELLIRALALISRSSKSFKAVFIGDGPLRSQLESLAAALGVEDKVVFLGTRVDVPRFYGIFDIYCLTSRYEGLPLSLLEAMAAGVPIVATDVMGIREVIRNNENGLLLPDNDAEELAKRILLLAENADLRNALSENGCRFVNEHYSLEKSVRNYEKLFRNVGFLKAQ